MPISRAKGLIYSVLEIILYNTHIVNKFCGQTLRFYLLTKVEPTVNTAILSVNFRRYAV